MIVCHTGGEAPPRTPVVAGPRASAVNVPAGRRSRRYAAFVTNRVPPRRGRPTCAICRKPFAGKPRAKTKSGKTAHASCLGAAAKAGAGNAKKKTTAGTAAPRKWNTAAAERAFEKNKEAVMSGETFRGHKASTGGLAAPRPMRESSR